MCAPPRDSRPSYRPGRYSSHHGTCKPGPLTLPSHTKLVLSEGASLVAADRENWPAPPAGGIHAPLLLAQNVVNITISGASEKVSVVDGLGAQWWPCLVCPEVPGNRPHLLDLYNASQVLLESFALRDAPSFHIDIHIGRDYVIRHLRIVSPNFQIVRNTDGVDIAATNVHVHDCYVHIDLHQISCQRRPGRRLHHRGWKWPRDRHFEQR